ncbi:hypothetical protein B0O99DRAFT_539963 [Bisporella sp. PMI_857]|nr:hypothetical protein B0O99DRAFT_539963 [Bisporella sp. PMI_857]
MLYLKDTRPIAVRQCDEGEMQIFVKSMSGYQAFVTHLYAAAISQLANAISADRRMYTICAKPDNPIEIVKALIEDKSGIE